MITFQYPLDKPHHYQYYNPLYKQYPARIFTQHTTFLSFSKGSLHPLTHLLYDCHYNKLIYEVISFNNFILFVFSAIFSTSAALPSSKIDPLQICVRRAEFRGSSYAHMDPISVHYCLLRAALNHIFELNSMDISTHILNIDGDKIISCA